MRYKAIQQKDNMPEVKPIGTVREIVANSFKQFVEMKVSLREKPISGNRKSLYLDFYPAIIDPGSGKKTRREFLKLYVYEKPKGELEREHNKETRIVAEGIRARRQLEVQAGRFGFVDKSRSKMDFVAFFKELAEKRSSSKGNHDNWASAYNYFLSFSNGSCAMEDLTEPLCNQFKEYLLTCHQRPRSKNQRSSAKKKLSQNAAHSYFNKFRAAVNNAYENRFIQENPIKRVKAIAAAETHREFLTIDELNILAKSVCDPPVLKTVALFSALTGMRWSDIVSMRWNQIHQKGDFYSIQFTQQKTKGVQYHPISTQARQLLGPKGELNELIFPQLEYSGWISQKLKIWLLSAGITKKITFHNFRHTYATLQLTNGTDIYTVSKMLGHKNLKTTQVYAKIVDQKKIEAANRIQIEMN